MPAAFIKRNAELLDSGDDDFVGIVFGEQAAHECASVGVFFDTAFLKPVEFLTSLAVKVFAIDNEKAFLDVGIVFEERGGLEGCERFPTTGGVPDVPVAAILVDAVYDLLHGVDLIRAHHHELLLAGD